MASHDRPLRRVAWCLLPILASCWPHGGTPCSRRRLTPRHGLRDKISDSWRSGWGSDGDADDVAEQIARAVGPSGANSDYLYNLCEALRALDIEDDDLYALEASVRAIRGD